MKKFICLVLTICALSFPNAMASEKSDINKTIELLTKLEIASDYTESTFPEEEYVTRALFVEYVARTINAEEEKSENIYYHDVSKDHWAFNYISVLTEKGIISGDGSNYFRPDEEITKNEAAKVLLSLMGYDAYAGVSGGFPNGYLKIAGDVKLFENCSSSVILTYRDMFCMIENALKGETAVAKFLDGEFVLSIDESTTLLGKYYDMQYEEGTLTGADGADVTGSYNPDKDIVIIDGVEYISKDSLFDYIGCKIEFIYYDNGMDDAEIIWVNMLSDNDIIEISSDLDCNFNDEKYQFEYYEENSKKPKKVTLKTGISVIYNGEFVDRGIEELLKKDRFDLKLIKNKNEKEYSIAIIWAYENYLVGSIDTEKKIIYDKKNPTNSVLLDKEEYDYCEILYGGVEKDFNDIAEENIVSIYKSLDGRKIKAEISLEMISGTVNLVSEDSNEETKVVFKDGTEHVYYLKNPQIDFSAGDLVDIYLDAKGYIVWTERTNKTLFYGYIIKPYIDEDDMSVRIKLLNENGKISTYKVREKAKLDGIKYEVEALYNELTDKQQIAVFKTDKNEEITYIDTMEQGNEDRNTSLKEYQPLSSRRWRSFGRLGTTLLLDSNTKIFAIDSDETSNKPLEERYMVKSKNDLVNDEYYNSQAFRIGNEDRVYEEVLLIKDRDWDAATSATSCILVTSVEQVVDEEDEIVELVTGYQGGTEVNLYTDGIYSAIEKNISEGDVIRAQINGNGKLAGAEIVYDYETKTSSNSSDAFASFRAWRMYAHDKSDKVLKVGYANGSVFDEIYNLSSTPIIVFDSTCAKGKKVRVGNIGDIKTYKMVGSDCSEVIVQTNWASPVVAIVYN